MTSSTSEFHAWHAALKGAVNRLYVVFARYPLDRNFTGCRCCVSPAYLAGLRKQPLRSLAPAALSRYAFKAMTTIGSPDDFRYFLPRLLELVADSMFEPSSLQVDNEVVLGKLGYANWSTWPDDERLAVRGYLSALWGCLLAAPPGSRHWDGGLMDWLCAIAQAELDLSPYLSTWTQLLRPAMALELSTELQDRKALVNELKLGNPYWSSHERPMRQVIEWLASPPVHQLLESAFFDPAHAEWESELSWACRVQEMLAERLQRLA